MFPSALRWGIHHRGVEHQFLDVAALVMTGVFFNA
jgi:hypothetical protein